MASTKPARELSTSTLQGIHTILVNAKEALAKVESAARTLQASNLPWVSALENSFKYAIDEAPYLVKDMENLAFAIETTLRDRAIPTTTNDEVVEVPPRIATLKAPKATQKAPNATLKTPSLNANGKERAKATSQRLVTTKV